jgi:hypothetical protein
MHAPRFGLVSREVPLRLRKYAIRAVATRAAMMDLGLAWVFGTLQQAANGSEKPRRQGARPRRAIP